MIRRASTRVAAVLVTLAMAVFAMRKQHLVLAAAAAALLVTAPVAFLMRGATDRSASPPAAPHLYAGAALRLSAPLEQQTAAVGDYYRAWKSAFVRRPCGAGTFQVHSPDAAFPYVAEAQGYGLVITASMADEDPQAREIFDGILRFVLAHPSSKNPDLAAAEQNADCADTNGRDSATDGDMDIAYGLLLADRTWGSTGEFDYRALAVRRIEAIKRSVVNPESGLMLLGDWSTPANPSLYSISRTSDWMTHHFRAFRAATNDAGWDRIRSTHQEAIADIRGAHSAATGLLPDFVQATEAGVAPVEGKVLESDRDGDFYYNACRIPWRIGLDALTSGDPVSVDTARAITAWARAATGGDPANVGAGYTLAGDRIGAGGSNAFWAPLAVAAMTDPTSQAWLDALWNRMAAGTVDPRYYFGTTIQLQVMLVITGRYTPVF